MELYMPTRIFSGIDCIKKHGKELASLGRKALIITGKHSSRQNGSLEHLKIALSDNQTEYVIFDEIEENPSIETIMKVRDTFLVQQVDFIIGLGGGSPMDAAKAIALMMANPDKGDDILYQSEELPYIPVVEIPTTAGTGSEVTPYAILTIHAKRTKQSISHRIYPKLALLDAEYLSYMGRDCLVNTAVDALAHLIESYLNTNANLYNRIYSEKGLRIWGKVKDHLENQQMDKMDYENLMLASTLGGMAITHTGTSLPHALSYKITYEMGIPHGKAVGVHLGGYMECYKDKRDIEQVLEFLGFQEMAELRTFLSILLGKIELEPELRRENVKDVMKNKAKLKNYPFPITEEELYKISK